MKTKTNIRKAALHSVALVVSLMLTVTAVDAKDLPQKNAMNNHENETAFLAMSKKEIRSVNASAEISMRQYTSKAFDPASELESWMLNRNYFETADMQTKNSSVVPAVTHLQESSFRNTHLISEEPLVLQEWMISSRFWSL